MASASKQYFRAGTSQLANPAVIFITVWTITLVLLSLKMTTQIVDVSMLGLAMLLGNMAMALFFYFFFAKVKIRKDSQFDLANFRLLNKYCKQLFWIWLFGTVLEVAVSGGVPLMWAISGGGFRDYTDFGIPSFHGIMNALYLQCMAGHFILWRVAGKRSSRTWFLLLATWPIFMLGRGIFLSFVMQCLAIFLMTHRVGIKRIATLTVLAFCNILLFGYLGNLRGTSNPFDYLISDRWYSTFEALPSGFLWVYIYVTSGINNIFYNIDTIQPTWSFDKTFFNLVPSFLRGGAGSRADNLVFADQNLNVSTFYASIISDFGALGGFCFASIVIFVAFLCFINARSQQIWGILAYSVLFQVLVFSTFYDMFLLLPTMMQVVVALLYYFVFRVKRRAYPSTLAECRT